MKDIEDLLLSMKKATPRQLSTSFTNEVLSKISSKNEESSIYMKLYKKPLGAVLSIALVVASSTAAVAAVTNWPSIVSVLTGVQSLDSGGRIVKIETEGCKAYESDDPSSTRISYYEIKKDSSLTNQQAVDMMRGICEEERAQSRVGELVKQTPGFVQSSRIYKIEQISRDSITVVSDDKYEGSQKGLRKTYTNIASDIRVSDSASALNFDQLQPGDSVVLVIVDERGISTETPDYTEDIDKMQVKAILKVPALTGSPDLFFQYLGKDFVRVEPTKDGKNFERIYEFDQ